MEFKAINYRMNLNNKIEHSNTGGFSLRSYGWEGK